MFKTKVDTRDELAAATSLPILAEVDKTNADDAIRTLRTNLLLNLKEGQKTVLVASNNTGDGKTFIAKKLEETFTAIGKKAAFIPADLRSGSCQLSIVNCQLPKGTHPADILASAEFAAQVAQAKADNDIVILDSPAISEYSDAYQLAAFADATLYVAKAGKTQKSDLESLHSNPNLPNPLIVFNV
jgi:Mrp family chromosome partitioning ATPase